MYYTYDSDSNITAKSDTPPTDTENYGYWGVDLDMDCYYYTVSAVKDHVIQHIMSHVKPAEQLAQYIKGMQAENDILGQTAAQLNLQNIQLNSTVDTLGGALAQAQLDIINLKGGKV